MRLFLILLFSMCCRSGNKGVELIDATQQSWVAGIRGGGAGVNYEFTVIAGRSSKVLVFEELWVGQQYLSFIASRRFPALAEHGFAKGDTVYVNATRFHEVDGFTPPETIQKEPPFDYEGQALLSYKIRRKQHYLVIKSIKTLKKQEYE